MYHDLFVCILQCSQDDNVWIGSKPRDPGHGLFKNVITASEQNKVDGVIAAPQGTTERLTAREPVLPGVASSTSIPHSRSQASVEGASELFPKLCGGIDHLLVGCNDQQKAAIHTEIARRIMEHIRLLAARKLSLVLDLDHTLLNSTMPDDVVAIADTISSPVISASLDFPGLLFLISTVTRVQKMGLLLLHWRYKLAGTPSVGT
ncbi:hypothetical protein B296_00042328 [Ensete ventricosum]|uniref:Uncharacterized protein n=1 Tax=Ensete ventricosum TaxID=4639 RepID=A0A426X917_ENSVE|nr:hypothetical protein B296_00042328 [Ensete ventricosum]